MSTTTLTVAVGQFAAKTEIAANQAAVLALIEQAVAQGAELLVLPEASMCTFAAELPILQRVAQQHSVAFVEWLQGLAQQHRLTIVVGVMSPSEVPDDPRVSNQLVVINCEGEIISRYTKLHLYDAFEFKESAKVRPGGVYGDGRELALFALNGFVIGLVNCYDLRFPEMSRQLVDAGAEVLSVSAAWVAGAAKELHWEVLLRARAIENTCYVLGSGQTAPRNIGQSMIVDPMGAIMAGAGEAPGIAVHTLSKARLDDVRQRLPCLVNRRYRP